MSSEVPFTAPPCRVIRSLWVAKTTAVKVGGDHWGQLDVTVENTGDGTTWSYRRNYPSMFDTFEPFHYRTADGAWHEYALIAPHYTATAVMDLATGEIIAAEAPSGNGFCPAGFHVPDWWDEPWLDGDDSPIDPSDELWADDMAGGYGHLGYASGCHWGDDHGWKLEVLDLSRLEEGVISRDRRFGYLELPEGIKLGDAIKVNWESGQIDIAVKATFSMETGRLGDWSLTDLNRGEARS